VKRKREEGTLEKDRIENGGSLNNSYKESPQVFISRLKARAEQLPTIPFKNVKKKKNQVRKKKCKKCPFGIRPWNGKKRRGATEREVQEKKTTQFCLRSTSDTFKNKREG